MLNADAAVRQLLIDKEISFTAVKETGRLWTYFNTQGTPSFRLLHKGFRPLEMTKTKRLNSKSFRDLFHAISSFAQC